ncbi:MAG TPA: hypothetical protein ENK78_00485, partial [Thiothrix sp.]|nr:hypothetical protein [Thiothrix sp.]
MNAPALTVKPFEQETVSQETVSKKGASLFQQTQFKRRSTQGEEQALGCIVCHRLDQSLPA